MSDAMQTSTSPTNNNTGGTAAAAATTTTGATNNNNNQQCSADAMSRLVFGKNDALFGAIEKQQGGKPFGSFLDAGTGLHSLRWMATLTPERGHAHPMTTYTAITADETMRRNVQEEANALGIGNKGNVIIGNWFHPHTPLALEQQKYDTILADYLIGAMDGFSPYQQDCMLPKLAALLKPGGRLYVVGLEPIPDSVEGDANVICKVRRIRDACILLAGHRCYREYPVDWIHRQFNTTSTQMKLLRTSKFPILYRHATIVKQINVARSKFRFFPTPEVAEAMKKVLDDLEVESLEATKRSPNGRLQLGFDYVVSAEKRAS
ncbi:expressed unknown protein [Seminavis robusta]|uniref:Uncharacterized protein n=1 Tax=Seminavis robusta TaxID=568900 RepID=A0A9N8HU23_9STRA|nr:expressed unknown protein [Seminavis robusta]|eukprot:Sro1982_g309180.1 n/a (320) ;mRNA; r:1843-2802